MRHREQEKTMFRNPLSRATALTVVALMAPLAVASASCWGEAPEAVLGCFSSAYSDRDAATLEGVLAPDYVWVRVAPPEVDVFSRETSVTASLKMFRDPEVELVSLEFEEGFRVVPGEEPNTWRIEELRATLTVQLASVAEPRVAALCVTLYVRQTGVETPGYQVYREVFFESEDCVGK
jgi:hypothetical protein